MSTALYAHGELQDGTTWANVRVTLASKIQLERSCKANKWDTDEDQFTTSAFLSWHAARLAKALPEDLKWDEFLKVAVDAGVTGTPDEDNEGDPTQPEAGTE